MRKIDELRTVCGILLAYVSEKKDLLDEKRVKELRDIKEELGVVATTQISLRDEIAVARSKKENTFQNLKLAITECRRTMLMISARDRKRVVVPALEGGLWKMGRIKEVTEKFLGAIEAMDRDPVLEKPGAALKVLYYEYVNTGIETGDKLYTLRTTNRALEKQLQELSIRVNSDLRFIAGHIPVEDRKELYKRIRAALPRRFRKASMETLVPAAQETSLSNTIATPVQTHTQVAA